MIARLLVLSDLHIGSKARCDNLNPYTADSQLEKGNQSDFLNTLLKFLEKEAPRGMAPISAIIVPGDISDRGDPREFKLADRVLRDIARAANVEPSDIYFAPGNHDVNWPVMGLQPSNFWSRYRYDPMLQDDLVFAQQAGCAKGQIDAHPHYLIWHRQEHLILSINTAAFDEPPGDQSMPNHGRVDQATLSNLKNDLADFRQDEIKLRTCILHHHPVGYFDEAHPDFSTLQNASGLLQLLADHRFDIVTHGHKHVPRIKIEEPMRNSHRLTVLGAGSVSARPDPQYAGKIGNLIHIIEARQRGFDGVIRGNIVSWEYYSRTHEWVPCRDGLRHVEPFGSGAMPAVVCAQVRDLLADVQRSGKNLIAWKALKRQGDDLAYVNLDTAFECLKCAANELGWTLIGESRCDNPDESWVLIRGG